MTDDGQPRVEPRVQPRVEALRPYVDRLLPVCPRSAEHLARVLDEPPAHPADALIGLRRALEALLKSIAASNQVRAADGNAGAYVAVLSREALLPGDGERYADAALPILNKGGHDEIATWEDVSAAILPLARFFDWVLHYQPHGRRRPVTAPVAESVFEPLDGYGRTPFEPLVSWTNAQADAVVAEGISAVLTPAALGGDQDGARLMQLLDRLGALEEDSELMADWTFRRAMANTVALVLRQRTLPDGEVQRVLSELRGHSRNWRLQLLAAIAVSKSRRIEWGDEGAARLQEDLWRHGDRHPQIWWTLAKELKTARVAANLMGSFEDLSDWARQRLVLSLVQLPASERTLLDRRSIPVEVSRYLCSDEARYFSGLLATWAAMKHPEFGFQRLFSLPETFAVRGVQRDLVGLADDTIFDRYRGYTRLPVDESRRLKRLLHDLVEAVDDGESAAGELRVYLDLLSLEVDFRENSATRPRGRYDTFRDFTKQVIDRAMGTRVLQPVVAALVECHEEGVRWAVAGELPRLYRRGGPQLFWGLAERLARDSNDWVVRDTLRSVREVWLDPRHANGEPDRQGVRAVVRAVDGWLRRAALRHNFDYREDVERELDELTRVSPPARRERSELHYPPRET